MAAFPGAAIPEEGPFEALLRAPVARLDDVRALAFSGIADAHRADVWRLLLDYLPTKKANREAELARKREQYRVFLREVTVKPGEDDHAEDAKIQSDGSSGEGGSTTGPSTLKRPSGQVTLLNDSSLSDADGTGAAAGAADADGSEERSKLSKYSSLLGGDAASSSSASTASATGVVTHTKRPSDASLASAAKKKATFSIFGSENDAAEDGEGTHDEDDDGASGVMAAKSRALQSSLFGSSSSSSSSSQSSSGPTALSTSSSSAGGAGAGGGGGLNLFGGRTSIFVMPTAAKHQSQQHNSSLLPSVAEEKPVHSGPAPDLSSSAGAGACASALTLTSVSDDPLSVKRGAKHSKWAEWHKDEELRAEIEKDVLRTSPGLHFFANPSNLAAMSRILFVYAKLNSGVRYVQGMNELLAPIWMVMATEGQYANSKKATTTTQTTAAATSEGGDAAAAAAGHAALQGTETQEDPLSSSPSASPPPPASDPSVITDAEADAFFCFMGLMAEVRDVFIKAHDNSATGVKGMLARYAAILGRREPSLQQHLGRLRLDHQFYAFRWLTTLLSREFSMPDVLMLWDSLLADPYRFSYLLHTCVGMMRLQRATLLSSDFGGCMKLLQNYPPVDFARLMFAACQVRDEEAAYYTEREQAQMQLQQQQQALRSPSTGGSGNGSGSNGSSGAAAAPRAPSLMRLESLQQQQQQSKERSGSSSNLHHTAFASAGLISPGASEPLSRTMAQENGNGVADAASSASSTTAAPVAPPRPASLSSSSSSTSFRTASGFESTLLSASSSSSSSSSGAPPPPPPPPASSFSGPQSPFSRLHGHPAFASPFADERLWENSGFGGGGDGGWGGGGVAGDYEDEDDDYDEDGGSFRYEPGGGIVSRPTTLQQQQQQLLQRQRRPTRRSKYYAFGATVPPALSASSSGGSSGGAGSGGSSSSSSSGPLNLSSLVKTVSSAFTVTDPLANLKKNQELKPVGHAAQAHAHGQGQAPGGQAFGGRPPL